MWLYDSDEFQEILKKENPKSDYIILLKILVKYIDTLSWIIENQNEIIRSLKILVTTSPPKNNKGSDQNLEKNKMA